MGHPDPPDRRLRPADLPSRQRRLPRPADRQHPSPLLHHHEPDGALRVACKTRRASRCPACAETYRADTYQLVRAGLVGGKGVPDTVTQHPAAFVTLTAPRSAPSTPRRRRRTSSRATLGATSDACPHGRPQSCTERHVADDPRLGEPLCPDCYDYTGSVLFNALAPELWRRFTLALRRRVAKSAGLTVRELRDILTVSFAKVAEYQRRGVVHFHAVIRFDGPDGPTTPPPGWATADPSPTPSQHAAKAVTATTPAAPRASRARAGLGRRRSTSGRSPRTGELSDQAVAGYIAKYATKAAECVGTLDRRIRPTDDLDQLPSRDHARRLITECLRLGALPELAELRLADWAHMLGFRGHFSTKSRRYSTTLGALRTARTAHNQREHQITTGRLPFDDDQVLVVAHWQYAGQGHSPGEAFLSAALSGKPLPPLLTGRRGGAHDKAPAHRP